MSTLYFQSCERLLVALFPELAILVTPAFAGESWGDVAARLLDNYVHHCDNSVS